MGLYLTSIPDKLAWLSDNLVKNFTSARDFTATKAQGYVPLAYVQNAPNWDMIAVLFDEREHSRFIQGRPDATILAVPLGVLLYTCPEAKEALKGWGEAA